MYLGARNRVPDRFHLERECLTCTYAGVGAVELEFVAHCVRAVDGRPGPGEHAPRAAMVATDERRDRVALRLVRLFVDQHQRVTATFVDRTRPLHQHREAQAVKGHGVEAAAVDMPRPTALTVAVRRKCV